VKIAPRHLLIFLILTRLILFFLPLINPDWTWNRWDGPHYLYLAQHGYTNVGDEANFIVFLPTFPLLVRAGLLLAANPEIVASGLSSILFIIAAVVFYKISSAKTVFLLTIFPTSFFFSAPYTESLFLLLISLVFLFAINKRWLPAGLAAGLLTLTRPFGFLVVAALLVEWLSSEKKRVRELSAIIVPSALAIMAYLYLNKAVYSDFFAFQKILNQNWYKSFEFPWRGIISSLKREDIMTGVVEGLTSIVAWAFIPISFVKKFKIKFSYRLYYLLGVVMFTSTSFILSTPRYLLSLPPFFMILARLLENKILFAVWTVLSAAGFVYLTQLFLRGQWAF